VSHDLDVVVVGAGVMGAATARSLAAAGRRVALVERFAVGHHRGSSHGSSRIFRLSYPEARWVRLAQESLGAWRALEAESGQTLLSLHGGLDIGDEVPVHERALREAGAACERLDAAALAGRFGVVAAPPEIPVLAHPDAGIAHAERAWRALVTRAVAHGCEVYEETVAQRLRQSGDGVEVDCGEATLHAGAAVVTAGAWATPLLATAGIRLDTTVTRETVAFFALPDGPAPSVVEWGEPAMYALDAPAMGQAPALKAGVHHAGQVVDPDTAGEPAADLVEQAIQWVRRRFPSADPRPLEAQTCLYTSTPDHDFVLRREGRIVVGSPCSGHGFKFAPVVGARLAALAAEAL